MKVRVEHQDHEDGCGSSMRIKIDDKKVFSVSDGESEDNTLSRNFNDCYSIPKLLQQAFEAGKNGEQFSIESVDLQPEDED